MYASYASLDAHFCSNAYSFALSFTNFASVAPHSFAIFSRARISSSNRATTPPSPPGITNSFRASYGPPLAFAARVTAPPRVSSLFAARPGRARVGAIARVVVVVIVVVIVNPRAALSRRARAVDRPPIPRSVARARRRSIARGSRARVARATSNDRARARSIDRSIEAAILEAAIDARARASRDRSTDARDRSTDAREPPRRRIFVDDPLNSLALRARENAARADVRGADARVVASASANGAARRRERGGGAAERRARERATGGVDRDICEINRWAIACGNGGGRGARAGRDGRRARGRWRKETMWIGVGGRVRGWDAKARRGDEGGVDARECRRIGVRRSNRRRR
jgi:hypothetical protein